MKTARLNAFLNEQVSGMSVVQAYARASGYQLIISDGVLFAAEMVDITPQVIAAVKAKAPAPAPAPAPKN